MTRPQRHFVFGAVVVVLLLAVAIGVAFPNDGDSLTMRLPVGRAVVHLEDHRILVRGLRLPRGRCDNCGYDMQGLENRSRCPECGDVEEPVDG
jgi:Zn finger protein HypA/HybF involved in hydrogenase expression